MRIGREVWALQPLLVVGSEIWDSGTLPQRKPYLWGAEVLMIKRLPHTLCLKDLGLATLRIEVAMKIRTIKNPWSNDLETPLSWGDQPQKYKHLVEYNKNETI